MGQYQGAGAPNGTEDDAAAGRTMQALHVLSWLFTLAAVPFLLAALDPAEVSRWWLAGMPAFPVEARARCFIAGSIVFGIGVTHYLARLIVFWQWRRSTR